MANLTLQGGVHMFLLRVNGITLSRLKNVIARLAPAPPPTVRAQAKIARHAIVFIRGPSFVARLVGIFVGALLYLPTT
jgi:hypothetical protein